MMLPPGSVVTVAFVDLDAVATAEPMASHVVSDAVEPPIPFAFSTNQAPGSHRRLAVQARISSDRGHLPWASDSAVAATVEGAPIELLLRVSG